MPCQGPAWPNRASDAEGGLATAAAGWVDGIKQATAEGTPQGSPLSLVW